MRVPRYPERSLSSLFVFLSAVKDLDGRSYDPRQLRKAHLTWRGQRICRRRYRVRARVLAAFFPAALRSFLVRCIALDFACRDSALDEAA